MADDENERFDYGVKLLMIGDSGVGKSCLLSRYTGDSFNESFIATIGIDFKIKYIDISDKKVKLQIWDTAGQERFRTITNAYYRGAMGVVLVYDCTMQSSFENVRNWMESIKSNSPSNVKVCLVGNKSDIVSARAVTLAMGQELADEFKVVGFFETSAKSGDNVHEVFTNLTAAIVDEFQQSASENTPLQSKVELDDRGRARDCCRR